MQTITIKPPKITVIAFDAPSSALDTAIKQDASGYQRQRPETCVPYMDTPDGFVLNSRFWGYRRLSKLFDKYTAMSHVEIGQKWKALPDGYKSTGICSYIHILAATMADNDDFWNRLEATVISDCCRYITEQLMQAIKPSKITS